MTNSIIIILSNEEQQQVVDWFNVWEDTYYRDENNNFNVPKEATKLIHRFLDSRVTELTQECNTYSESAMEELRVIAGLKQDDTSDDSIINQLKKSHALDLLLDTHGYNQSKGSKSINQIILDVYGVDLSTLDEED